MQNLELFNEFENKNRLTISEAFTVLWKLHLEGKPCQRALTSHRKKMIRFFNNKYIDSITEFDFKRYKDARLSGSFGRRVQIGTVWHSHTLLTLLYSKFYEWKRRGIQVEGIDFRDVNLPMEAPTKYIKKAKAAPRSRIITPEEFSKILEHADEDLKKTFIIAIDTGIRPGDIVRLEKSNYNPYTDNIEFVQHKTGYLNKIPVTNRVRKIFSETNKKYVVDAVNLRSRFEKCRRDSKVNFQFRDIRRTCITTAYRNSKDIKLCQFLAGHRDPRTTDLYIVSSREWMKPAVKKIEEIYF